MKEFRPLLKSDCLIFLGANSEKSMTEMLNKMVDAFASDAFRNGLLGNVPDVLIVDEEVKDVGR